MQVQQVHRSDAAQNSPVFSTKHVNLCKAYETIIRYSGDDSRRPGLIKTPERAARAMLFFTKGYEDNLNGEYIIHSSSSCHFWPMLSAKPCLESIIILVESNLNVKLPL